MYYYYLLIPRPDVPRRVAACVTTAGPPVVLDFISAVPLCGYARVCMRVCVYVRARRSAHLCQARMTDLGARSFMCMIFKDVHVCMCVCVYVRARRSARLCQARMTYLMCTIFMYVHNFY
jgi:hypothetical protein